MGEEKNPAMPASGQAFSQMGLVPENTTQNSIIPECALPGRAFSIPAGGKSKKRMDLDYKKASSWLIILMVLYIPPFYYIGFAER